jgi:hypothetical protein
LSYHAQQLPKKVTRYADPSGANEICELQCANFIMRKGNNTLRMGIAAVSARLEAGTLRVVAGRCPNLLAEAELYRYEDDTTARRSENPLDEHNHALAALRYMVASLDARKMTSQAGRWWLCSIRQHSVHTAILAWPHRAQAGTWSVRRASPSVPPSRSANT